MDSTKGMPIAGVSLNESAAAASTLFRKEGPIWTLAFDGRVCHLPDSRGLRYLAHLLQRPGEPVPAVELIDAVAPAAPEAVDTMGRVRRERARLSATKGIRAALRRIEAVHPVLAQHLEATVRRGYVCRYTPDPRLPIRWEG